jgi:hypothetical protein
MTEKFNFYDIYGYLLPGMAFLVLLWLPFGIVWHRWPQADLSSAVAALALAYIAGHVLQTFLVGALPYKVRDSHNQLRYPSQFLLDPRDSNFSEQFKESLAGAVLRLFDIELQLQAQPDDAGEDTRRREAFFLCRSFLVAAKLASYAEQYEGMYALTGGLAGAFWLGSAYLLGWGLCRVCDGLHGFWDEMLLLAFAVAVVISFWLIIKYHKWAERLAFGQLVLVALAAGLLFLGMHLGVAAGLGGTQASFGPRLCTFAVICTDNKISLLALSCGVSLLAGLRCYIACKIFAVEFAKAVWRDFLCSQLT